MECVNLKERFGKKYRVDYEESYYAERGDGARADDPWLQTILCQRGRVFPWGGDKLAASTNGRGPTATKLTGLHFVTVPQDGDDGVTVVFPVDKFAQIAKLMLPRRRRQVSDAERARLAAMGAGFRFSPGTQSSSSERQSTNGVKGGILVQA